MHAKVIDGKAIAAQVRAGVKERAQAFAQKTGRRVGLAVILVGENPASKIYVRNKIAACEEADIRSASYHLPADTPEEKIVELLETLNADKNTDGILVQLPLPAGIDEKRVLGGIELGGERVVERERQSAAQGRAEEFAHTGHGYHFVDRHRVVLHGVE